ncbi:uncharacterized protein LOC123534853 isoform X2 [Mercenaria mercenaria]|uniref:uncharacterized protein LOC123534853 isoform X2 n=1 Tax=Mercenaria mercenaria TaxID=6596 RepID=UPI00234E428F|nr:uncharacterized protein LOC123534853 isoform X2 [Mercenaria mercenaria]
MKVSAFLRTKPIVYEYECTVWVRYGIRNSCDSMQSWSAGINYRLQYMSEGKVAVMTFCLDKFNALSNNERGDNGTDRLVSVQSCLNRKPEFLKRSKEILRRNRAQTIACIDRKPAFLERSKEKLRQHRAQTVACLDRKPEFLKRSREILRRKHAYVAACLDRKPEFLKRSKEILRRNRANIIAELYSGHGKLSHDDSSKSNVRECTLHNGLARQKDAYTVEILGETTLSYTDNNFDANTECRRELISSTGSYITIYENLREETSPKILNRNDDNVNSSGVSLKCKVESESDLNNLNSSDRIKFSSCSLNIQDEEQSLCTSLKKDIQYGEEQSYDNTAEENCKHGQVQSHNPEKLDIATGVDEFYSEKSETWTTALDTSNEKAARHLLKLGVLPQSDEVAKAYKTFGKTEIFLEICQNICSYLEEKSKDIVNVWSAYRKEGDEETDVVFVVCTRSKSIEVDFEGFSIYQRAISEYSSESRKVLAEELNTKFDKTLLNKLKLSTQAHAKTLMENHSNISMISPSIFKSKRFGQARHELIVTNKPCIVLYVHIKGLIPIKEEPFPSEIDGFPTDVREAGFTLFNGGPNEFHENLKMGCAVHANVTNTEGDIMGGTLGGFVHHPEFGNCCLTCAHVVSKPDDMINLRDNNGGKAVIGTDCNYLVYQPVSHGSRHFGRLVSVVYKEGGEGKSGVDAALIQITKRFPRSGDFPDADNYREAGFDQNRPMIFNTGMTRNLSDDDISTEVVKFGAITGVTRGVVRMNGSIIRRTNMCGYSEFGYLLHNQVEILSVGGNPFALSGDSGALVFAKDRSNELVAVGMVEGGMSDGRIMITPICEILTELISPSELQTKRSPSDEHPPFYLKLQPPTDSLEDSGFDMAVDVSNENTIPKQQLEHPELASAVQTLQTEMGQVKHEMAAFRNSTTEMINGLSQKLDLLLLSKPPC